MMLHIEDYEKPEGMAILVVEFLREGYKTRKIFGKKSYVGK